MKSFHSDIKIKNKYVDRISKHIAADNLVKGKGWKNGKGCAIGCTLENYNHKQYEVELGIPEWLAKVEDVLFEGMSYEKSKTWPLDFLKSIPVGVNLEPIKTKLIVFILKQNLLYLKQVKYDKKKNPSIIKSIKLTINAIKKTIKYHEEFNAGSEWAAKSAAWAAAASAEAAAKSAAWSEWAAKSAAWAAAASAEAAAKSAKSAAWAAAASAEAAAESVRSVAWSGSRSVAASAEAAAKSAAYDKYADYLLKLLRKQL